MRGLLLVLALLASGCLGADHVFPDESDQVQRLHVNAYAPVGAAAPRPGIVEVSGLGGDEQARAFHGQLVFQLDEQTQASPVQQYAPVRNWTVAVTSDDFASTTVPFYRVTLPASNFPRDGTYRASVTATILGRTFQDEALFAWTRA